ncbi:MAG: NADPH-dependent FMN reductase, partial [Aestuariivirga sp.]
MNLLGISGALRKGSTNTGLLRALEALAPEHVTIEIATLHGIPLYDGDAEAAQGKPQSVKDLDARIRAADGIIIATPEYNFSIPGVLKNA